MFKLILKKADGRQLLLYSRNSMASDLSAPTPSNVPIPMDGAHMRWHSLRGEWVAYAGHRGKRPFLPPKEHNPLGPTLDPLYPTEIPQGEYDVAVFENMFPTLSLRAPPPPGISEVPTLPALGICEVVVFTKDYDSSLGQLPLTHIALILEVWADRYCELGNDPNIQYILAFENRGEEVGVTLHHPHGQIYAYPFVPPVVALHQAQELSYFLETGSTLLTDFISREVNAKVRMIYEGDRAVAFVPVCARYPYEVWIAPRRRLGNLAELDNEDRMDFARALKTVALKYDGLWQKKFPYLMVIYQAPTDGGGHPETHFHFEFLPPYRSENKLKYLAGSEIGAGFFANDTFPEMKAKELQAVTIQLEEV